MKKEDVKEFWIKKEEEKNSKLVVATVAEYLNGDEQKKISVTGLLYFMDNGIYFENFSNHGMFNAIFGFKENFKKIEFSILKSSIVKVSDFTGKKNKKELGIKDKIFRFLNITPRVLLVNYLENNQMKTAKFKSIEEPLSICEKFYSTK